MRQEQYENEMLISRKKNQKRKRRIVQGVMIIILCLLTFLGGRASAEAGQKQNMTSLSEYGQKQNMTLLPEVRNQRSDIENKEMEKPASDMEADEEQNDGEDEENEESDFNVWNLILVNKSHPIPSDFSIDLEKLKNGHAIDKRAYPDLQAMMDDARAAGLSPLICSSYRTMEKQTSLYDRQVKKYQDQGYSEEEAEKEAGKWVAVPGTSEHQAGLAVDIVSETYQSLDKQQESTAEQVWLMENCHKYGFILRYPEEKSDITGIGYEPWHYRYVGKEAASEITERGICLEEYLNN